MAWFVCHVVEGFGVAFDGYSRDQLGHENVKIGCDLGQLVCWIHDTSQKLGDNILDSDNPLICLVKFVLFPQILDYDRQSMGLLKQ